MVLSSLHLPLCLSSFPSSALPFSFPFLAPPGQFRPSALSHQGADTLPSTTCCPSARKTLSKCQLQCTVWWRGIEMFFVTFLCQWEISLTGELTYQVPVIFLVPGRLGVFGEAGALLKSQRYDNPIQWASIFVLSHLPLDHWGHDGAWVWCQCEASPSILLMIQPLCCFSNISTKVFMPLTYSQTLLQQGSREYFYLLKMPLADWQSSSLQTHMLTYWRLPRPRWSPAISSDPQGWINH